MTTDGLARLGELRRRQGRLDEAASLFDRSAGHPIAALGRAALALDRGDAQSATELAERHLRKLPVANRTERAAALELLVRAHASAGRKADLSRAWVGTSWALALLFALTARRLWHARFGHLRETGTLAFRTVIVGTNDEAQRLLRIMQRPASDAGRVDLGGWRE